MSLKHALLGFLRRGPQTGYTLKNEYFDKSVAYFWPADQTQIYKTLDKLVDDGLLTSAIQIQSGKPNRKIYSITKNGQTELENWLKEPAEPAPYRDSLLVQLFFSENIEDSQVIEVLQASHAKHEELLAELTSIKLPAIAKCSNKRQLSARLTLEMGLKKEQAYIDWLKEAIAAIKSFERKAKRQS